MKVKEFIKVISGIDRSESSIAVLNDYGWELHPINDKEYEDREIFDASFDSKADLPFVRIYLK